MYKSDSNTPHFTKNYKSNLHLIYTIDFIYCFCINIHFFFNHNFENYMKLHFYLKSAYSFTMLLLLSSCATKPKCEMEALIKGSPGFWTGLWQGIILPFSLLGKIFDLNIGIHETRYSGSLYWLGYLIGIILLMKLVAFFAALKAKSG